ncbi:MAG: hypothetical protein U9Q82_04740 [Chloroflexota bacterium]|nr:hypothetical protein [Chloroflexota bacterium]
MILILRGRLKGQQLKYLSRLLDMEYTTTELSKIVGFSRRQIYRVYRKMSDFPHRIDTSGRIWINGVEFREWYYKKYGRGKYKLASDETFCLTCRRGVKIVEPDKCYREGLEYLESECPHCGRKLSRILKKEKKS